MVVKFQSQAFGDETLQIVGEIQKSHENWVFAAEFVCERGLGDPTRHMQESDFSALWRSEAERLSGRQFRVSLESLAAAQGYGIPGLKPVEDRVPTAPEHPGDLLHRP